LTVEMLKSLLVLASLAIDGSLAWKAGSQCSSSYSYINYTTVPGFFVQDDPATSTTGFDYVYLTPNLNLFTSNMPT
jgi:hypothetical protein